MVANVLGSITDGLKITDYNDWLIFVERLKELIASGLIKRIPGPIGDQRFAKEDEWYLDPATGETYVHVIPDAPVLPRWVKVDLLAPTQALKPHPNNLSVIPIGKMGRIETRSLKTILGLLMRQDLVEEIAPLHVPESADSTEMWFKDCKTGVIYRLIEKDGGEENLWERVPQAELHMRTQ